MKRSFAAANDAGMAMVFYGYASLPTLMAEVEGGEMNILVIGSGGREHALAWKLAEPDSYPGVRRTRQRGDCTGAEA